MNVENATALPGAPLTTPTRREANGVEEISGALTTLLADVFALYVKTKNFRWQLSRAHLRNYHLLVDEQAGQIFADADVLAQRVRKIGGTMLQSMPRIGRSQRGLDGDADFVTPSDSLREFRDDRSRLIANRRETGIDEAERPSWFRLEAIRPDLAGG